ncbi:hypothetical protein HAX54_020618 [Datura stramonium]|uniref:Uncharacterized protein n=1 Tax=Datura stramonium TaxID=4076 RepID=A0ABS8UUB0_DATST|nr:hypothetical protein [Datura stramonium]
MKFKTPIRPGTHESPCSSQSLAKPMAYGEVECADRICLPLCCRSSSRSAHHLLSPADKVDFSLLRILNRRPGSPAGLPTPPPTPRSQIWSLHLWRDEVLHSKSTTGDAEILLGNCLSGDCRQAWYSNALSKIWSKDFLTVPLVVGPPEEALSLGSVRAPSNIFSVAKLDPSFGHRWTDSPCQSPVTDRETGPPGAAFGEEVLGLEEAGAITSPVRRGI